LRVVREYELALLHHDQGEIARLTEEMEHLGAWDAETEVKQILTRLKITDLEARVGELSGGQKKRLGLAKVLISHPDFLLLDEPTNHLDLDMIEWLETYLERSSTTLLMVTHDRYFLDRVCDEILELENNEIFRYAGNYSYFLEKREERMEARQAGINRARNLLRTEIEWMRRMPQARSHKAKYRINAFTGLQEKARARYDDKTADLSIRSTRLGKKIMEINNLSKGYGDLRLIEDFSYTFSRFEKVGIVGDNGTGKTTFLHLITGMTDPDAGTISVGSTIRFGHYRQSGIEFNPRDKVLDAVTRISEVIGFEDGTQATAQQMLTRFLFPPAVQHDYVEKLSGGEQRRLYLCTVLMQKPNFLLLDEPTNDLDILTLNVLEEYLREFEGCLIIVSHDRFFMDKIIDHLFIFEGNGKVTDFPGNYTQYRNAMEEAAAGTSVSGGKATGEPPHRPARKEENPKLTFREKREMESLETEIAALESRKRDLEALLNGGTLGHEALYETSLEIGRISGELDEKELRWLELSEKQG
ncbi:MAG TPA: ABC-F family ATP-binding cassette domain-containing protein, partial [Prolixibacteraceae bacterium]|nr:ABC-F family ATP-binding cassette domain-containing protein [Prolixibacteraceae bacterium]